VRYNKHLATQQRKHTMQATVNYVPASQKEWRELLKYIDINSAAIELRKTKEYFAEVAVCADTLSKHFKVYPPQLINKVCPWEKLGVRAKLQTIARKYSVPAYMINCDIMDKLDY
jgi:hypothetical protein